MWELARRLALQPLALLLLLRALLPQVRKASQVVVSASLSSISQSPFARQLGVVLDQLFPRLLLCNHL